MYQNTQGSQKQGIPAEWAIVLVNYTAMTKGLDALMPLLNGVTVTLHTPSDYLPFWRFDQSARNLDGKSLRLNIFEEVGPVDCSTRWQVKDHMKWILNCPLPEGEILMRYRPTQDIDCR